ncbi:MAG: hypothetical protein ACKO5E_17235 [bacterium]
MAILKIRFTNSIIEFVVSSKDANRVRISAGQQHGRAKDVISTFANISIW